MLEVTQSNTAGTPESSRLERAPWTVWTSVLATISVVVGDVWDISWHISVGRDTFWTLPHMLIQLCAAIGGLTALYVILKTTFGHDETAREAAVEVLGLRGPLGAWVCGWGALAMVTSAPFDNWWHLTYGLDVKVLSPPHAVLFLGATAVILGGLLLIAAPLNRASQVLTKRLDTVFICLLGVLMMGVQADLIEFSNRVLMHSAFFYRCCAIPFPALMILVRGVSRRRWACTVAVAVYTVLSLAQGWLLPLFPAEQRLGPVYQHVPYMVPLGFPLLVFGPAVLIDRAWSRVREWVPRKQAAILGSLFLLALLALQWPFADFLLSPRSANWVFGTQYRVYFAPPDTTGILNRFYAYEASAAEFWRGMAIALATAILSSRVGLALAQWLRSVQR